MYAFGHDKNLTEKTKAKAPGKVKKSQDVR